MTIEPIHDISAASQLLLEGRLVVFPTETVYGLGGRVDSDETIKAIFSAKERPVDNPLIVHVASVEMARRYAVIGPVEEGLFNIFSPGPLTLVCPLREGTVSTRVTGGGATVAVRIPDSEIALDVIRRVNCGLAAPSANRSGRPSPTDAEHACVEMNGRVSAVLDGGRCRVGIESTVSYWDGEKVIVLRPGAITERELNEVAAGLASQAGNQLSRHSSQLNRSAEDTQLNRSVEDTDPAQSPGTRYRHYAPRVPVRLFTDIVEIVDGVTNDREAGIACICSEGTAARLDSTGAVFKTGDRAAPGTESNLRTGELGGSTGFTVRMRTVNRETNATIVTFPSYEVLSANLYRWLWQLEDAVSAIWIELPPDRPEFAGIRDRLWRAAHLED